MKGKDLKSASKIELAGMLFVIAWDLTERRRKVLLEVVRRLIGGKDNE